MDGTSTRSRKAAVRLDAQQRLELEQCTRNGVRSAKQILDARIQLLADEEHALVATPMSRSARAWASPARPGESICNS